MKFGCCVGIDKYEDLVRIGYDYIELAGTDIYKMTDEEFDNAKDLIKNGPIKCPRVNAFLLPSVRVVGDDADWKKIKEYMDKVVNRAGTLGVETIGFGSPASRNIPEGFSKEKAIEQLVESIKYAADKAERYGIKILVEPVNSRDTNFICKVSEAMEIMKMVDKKSVRLLIDLYHLWLEKEDISAISAEAAEFLSHTHIAEDEGRTYLMPSKMDKYKTYIGRFKTLGYDGTLSIEADYKDFVSEASTSLEMLREIDK